MGLMARDDEPHPFLMNRIVFGHCSDHDWPESSKWMPMTLMMIFWDMRIEHLYYFINDVFHIDVVAERFFTAPASRDNHHDFVGGLALHSMEVMALFFREAHGPIPLSWDAIEIGMVAALLHDIGKVDTDLRDYPAEARRYAHEQRGLELLAEPLAKLREHEPEVAETLAYHLGGYRKVRGASGRLLQCLRNADQASACLNNELTAVAFGNRCGDHIELPGRGPRRAYFASSLLSPPVVEVSA